MHVKESPTSISLSLVPGTRHTQILPSHIVLLLLVFSDRSYSQHRKLETKRSEEEEHRGGVVIRTRTFSTNKAAENKTTPPYPMHLLNLRIRLRLRPSLAIISPTHPSPYPPDPNPSIALSSPPPTPQNPTPAPSTNPPKVHPSTLIPATRPQPPRHPTHAQTAQP